jgi:hypothetical protein
MSEAPQKPVNPDDIKTLPAVASNFFFPCKKCSADRYHKVLTHPTSTSAKLECEVCKAKQTFKLGVAKKKKATGNGLGRTRKKAPSAQELWSELKSKADLDRAESYNMKKKFGPTMAINHPKFGVGIVTEANAMSIVVTFEDGPKSLVHNRS